ELQALADSRPNPEAPLVVGMASTWAGNVRNDVEVRTYQLVMGLEGAFTELDWSWEAYVSSGVSTSTNENVGNTSVQRWRHVINQPNYGKGLYQQGNEEGAGFGAGAIQCT